MAVANLEELCAGFCEIVKIAPPALSADALGQVAFHVVLRGETVNLVHRPNEFPEHVFVVFELGPVGAEGADAAVQMCALLDANFAPLQLHAPVFSRNPQTGDVLLQYIYPLFEATPTGLYELIDTGLNSVDRWRHHVHDGETNHADEPARGNPALNLLQHFA
jgi:hypothetical protein